MSTTETPAVSAKARTAPNSQPGTPEYEAEIAHWIMHDPSRTERIARAILVPFIDYFYRQRAYGAEHVPRDGAFIIAGNHSSYMDPFLLARPQSRLFRFMAKSTLLETPVLGWITKNGGGFPVRRGKGDGFAMDLALRLLHDGQPVCIFPEGTRFRASTELGPARSGAAILAIQSGVPVVPSATFGAKPPSTRGERGFPWRLPRVTTVYGPPMTFSGDELDRDSVEHVRDAMWAEVQRLYVIAEELHASRPKQYVISGPVD